MESLEENDIVDSKLKNKHVFVSGGAGVIGQEMIPKLVARGAVVLVGDLKPRPAAFPVAVSYWQGDLNELQACELESFRPEVFIHLADAFKHTTESIAFWDENFWHNVRLSHHLMSLVRSIDSMRRVVFASSYLIYDSNRYQFDRPAPEAVRLRETDPIQPRNLVGMAKLVHEAELNFLRQFDATPFTAVNARIFRGYGRNSRDVISRWVRALLAGQPITVYRPEGRFDYTYGADSAEGLIRLAEAWQVQGVVNLGSGKSRTVQEVVDILRGHFPALQMQAQDSDIAFEASEADMTRFRDELGWLPEYTLERGIEEIVRYERNKLAAGVVGVKKPRGNVLVTSAAGKVPLVRAVRAALRRLDVEARTIAGDVDGGAIARHVADDFWQMPATSDAHVDALLSGCRERNVEVVLPTRDGELSFWARHRQRFESEGIYVAVSDEAGVDLCLDKLAFAAHGQSRQLPFVPASDTIDAVGAGPYVVKERYGAGSKAIGLDLGRTEALAHAANLQFPIFQPMIHGREISIDAWLGRNGKAKGVVLRYRNKIVTGESQITTTFFDDGLEKLAMRILSDLNLAGPVVMQAIVDAAGSLHVIECNARFGGASTAAIAVGLNLIEWTLLEAWGESVDNIVYLRAAHNVRQIRIPTDIYDKSPDL